MIDHNRLFNTFMELCAIDSEPTRERLMADRLTERLSSIGFAVSEDDTGKKIGGSAGNLYARLEGTAAGEALLFSCHMDRVVPGVNVKPRIEGDYIVSDGTTVLGADDASGLAAILEGITALKQAGKAHPTIELVLSVAEELSLVGSKHYLFTLVSCASKDYRTASRESAGIAPLPTASRSKAPQVPLLAADATILAFGDSITYGTGAGDSESYPAVLATLIGRKLINAGVPGEVSATGVQRLPELLERELPALLILCHGGNDLLARANHQLIADNLRSMIRMAVERGVVVLLVAVPSPDLTLKPPSLYEDLAKEFNIPLELKVLQRILGKSSLKSDHIHPNAAGYRQLAEALAGLMKKCGALSP